MIKTNVTAEIVRVLRLEGDSILACADRVAQPSYSEQLEKAMSFFQKSLDQGGKIIVTGVGKSGKVGQKIAATLCSTGSLAVYLHPTEGLHGDLGMIRPQDSVLALSYTGNTDEVIRLLPALKRLGVSIVGLGGNSSSVLAEGCDAWIDAHVDHEACPHNLAPTTSTTLALALGDALAVSLMRLRGFDAQAFAENHPGGSIGKKLTLTVGDLMRHGDAVGVLGAEATMEEVVILSTQKQLGAVLVVQGSKLIGIVTDGDIRRSLQLREKFFQLKAGDIMTRKPITVHPNTMAQVALRLMEDRPSQIGVLPVVDELGNWKGLLRLHDVVRTF